MPKNKKIDDITKIIPIIRKVTGKPIVQIKSIIENNESVLESNRFILEELELILITAQKLIEVGSIVEIERSGQVSSIQVLKNIIERSGIIAKQSQDLIDEEVNEEESDLAVFIIESVLHLDDIGCDVNGKYENPDMCFDVNAPVKIIRNGNMVHTAAMLLAAMVNYDDPIKYFQGYASYLLREVDGRKIMRGDILEGDIIIADHAAQAKRIREAGALN